MNPEPNFDERLWFTMRSCCSGKHYLVYNPHTFPGRMGAWCPEKRINFCVSKSEIKQCSVEAQFWMQGFLVGNEPDAPTNEEGDYLPESSPAFERWRTAREVFPQVGFWIKGERECDSCGVHLLPTDAGLCCSNCL